jgi:hypothetical protein
MTSEDTADSRGIVPGLRCLESGEHRDVFPPRALERDAESGPMGRPENAKLGSEISSLPGSVPTNGWGRGVYKARRKQGGR